jgi:hypothetical protein
MQHAFFTRRPLALIVTLGAVASGLAASPALASQPVDTSSCVAPILSQAFSEWGDHNWYFLAPGQSATGFNAAGWTLSGGARLVTTTLQDGSTGTVLDLPSGASATSPMICIATNYPLAKSLVRSVSGPPGIGFTVKYLATGNSKSTNVPSNNGWGSSVPMNLSPSNISGWQPVELTYTATGKNTEYQLYNLYVDPRCT